MKTNREIAEILLKERKEYLLQHELYPSFSRLEELAFTIGVMSVLENMKRIFELRDSD